VLVGRGGKREGGRTPETWCDVPDNVVQGTWNVDSIDSYSDGGLGGA
jgi:hypothetical protein